ncbi:MAG: hypothetical protein ACRD8Z_15075, partial [Nitrososphaeraceae archaeon]
KSELKSPNIFDLWPRLPHLALKFGIVVVCSFVILGTIAILNPQSTTSSSTYVGYDENSPFMFASSSSLAIETQKGKAIPVEHVYGSQHDRTYSDGPAAYEGIFTKLVASQPTPSDDPPSYYLYIITQKNELLLLEQIQPRLSAGDLNSTLSAIQEEHGKVISTT